MARGFRVINECIEYEGERIAMLDTGLNASTKYDVIKALENYQEVMEQKEDTPNKNTSRKKPRKKLKQVC